MKIHRHADFGNLLPSESQRLQLEAPLPETAIREKPGGKVDRQGRPIVYVDGYHVVSQLNEVFGHGLWSYKAVPRLVWEGTSDTKKGPVYACGYLAQCTLRIGPHGSPYCSITDVGSGSGRDPFPPDAHESAAKEACTDALKRCAKNLGPRFGLALYDDARRQVASVDECVKELLADIDGADTVQDLEAGRSAATEMKKHLNDSHVASLKAAIEAATKRLKEGTK